MADLWPEARIYTSLYDPEGTEGHFAHRSVRTSYLQRLGVGQRGFRRLLPLFPAAIERLPVAGHDVLVSSSSAFAHGVRPAPGAVHVCYCYSPFRYVWHEREATLAGFPRVWRPAAAITFDAIRRWDIGASERVTRYLCCGEIARERIHEFYGREASVVHPPVEVERFDAPPAPEDHFLVVCELVAHKRVDLALEAARRSGKRVQVVGTGPEAERLAVRYAGVAEFLGRVDDAELARLYSRALALVVPNIEEFGIAAVEAQAAGRPVLAVDGGGARETVRVGETGVLVSRTVDALGEAMSEIDFTRFEPAEARANAANFSRARFQERLAAQVRETVRMR
ncbi:MAG: glycosyltransferase [Solirubrobacterales bacterium]|nr:glycosyltransferase [Solirubrobacterales bacterium]